MCCDKHYGRIQLQLISACGRIFEQVQGAPLRYTQLCQSKFVYRSLRIPSMSATTSPQQLQVIPMCEWPKLRDLYRRDWPQHILSFHTLKNYVEWAVQNPQMDDVRISSIDADWRQHGTYILEDRNKLRYNVYFNTLQPGRKGLMLAALDCLEVEPAYTLTAYMEQVRPAAEQLLRGLGTTDFQGEYCPTQLYYLPKEESCKLELRYVHGFVMKPLTEEYTKQIDNMWLHQYPGSDYFIRRVIRYNMTFGAFEETSGNLCAWVMQVQLGTIGLLQVEEAYKRRGLGEQLVHLLAVKMAERGMDATATIMDINVPSKRIFEKMGFRPIDRVYWFDKPAVDANKHAAMVAEAGLRRLSIAVAS